MSTEIKINRTEIKQKVEGILSLTSTIACFTKPNIDMHPIFLVAQQIFLLMDDDCGFHEVAALDLEMFCNVMNSMTFNFNKSGLKVNIPKIDISLLKMGKYSAISL